MATKVKGDKIKEGSIPLSALATEVKDKIENAGADWNAQEGEAGYIENKPFSIKLTELDFTLEENNTVYTYVDNDLVVDGNTFYIKDAEGNIYITPDELEFTSVDFIGPTQEYISIYYSHQDLSIVFSPDTTMNENILNWCKTHIYHCKIFKLDARFIQDTVIKTTPQTLTNNTKNQALANLGINPVVWKYLLKPYKIAISYDYTEHMASFIDTEISDSDLVKVLIRIPEIGRLLIVVVANSSAYPVTIYHDDTPHYRFKVLDGDIGFILNEDGTISEG